MRLTDKAAFAVEFLDLAKAAEVADAVWEPFQLALLNTTGRFSIDNKARQIAWSFTAALDAVVDGILSPGTPHIFVSVNQDEAKEKIRYARQIVDALDPDVRPALARDSQTEVEFKNGSRFVSFPCRPPRGKARARIYLDEMAHYAEGMDREVYRGALPATTKGDGYIRIGSSPMGARGVFWEIFAESLRRYPGYVRRQLPWWTITALCEDVEAAQRTAPKMTTEERVLTYGTPALIDIFQNSIEEDFQQEYECAWVDESSAWIDWALIQANQDDRLVCYHARSVADVLDLLPHVEDAIARGDVEGRLCGGIDVGRRRNLTEMMVVGKGATDQRPVRFMISLERTKFDQQLAAFEQVIDRLPFAGVLIDENGLGMQLAEDLRARFHSKVQPASFTNITKELWAVEARVQFERNNVPIPPDRNLAYQIHSIKKKVTQAKNNVFDTERNEKHHADKFWALSLALWVAQTTVREPMDQKRFLR